MKVVRLSALRTSSLCPRNILVLIFRGWVDPRAHRLVGCSGKKSPVTWPGIDPGTYRLAALRQTRKTEVRRNIFILQNFSPPSPNLPPCQFCIYSPTPSVLTSASSSLTFLQNIICFEIRCKKVSNARHVLTPEMWKCKNWVSKSKNNKQPSLKSKPERAALQTPSTATDHVQRTVESRLQDVAAHVNALWHVTRTDWRPSVYLLLTLSSVYTTLRH